MPERVIRGEIRLPEYLHDQITNLAKRRGLSFNRTILEAIKKYCTDALLNGDPNIDPSINPEAYAVGLLTRINAANDSAKELRIIGECGIAQSFEQFMMLQNRVTSEVRDRIMHDKLANGPYVYNDPGSDEAIEASKKYEIEMGSIGSDGTELESIASGRVRVTSQTSVQANAPNGALDVRAAENDGIIVKDDPEHNQNAPSEAAKQMLKDLEGLE